MKLKYKHTEKGFGNSFFVTRQKNPHLESNWHFHEEFELIYIVKGTGIGIVGDNISNFRPPKLVLSGQWLPHVWKNDELYMEDDSVDVIIFKFTRLFNGQDIFSLPEFSSIAKMLDLSKRGISFKSKTIEQVHELLIQAPESQNAAGIISLLKILDVLSQSTNYKLLSSPEFTLPITLYGENRLSRVINFISTNYHRAIDLDELANEAAMTRSSLCRFFKNRTNKTIFQFINEFRIGKACQSLINGDQSVSEICYSTGFNSITSFNRVFKSCKSLTPIEFKKQYVKLNNIDWKNNKRKSLSK
jgi:AraC-like DNA-binding protein